MHVAGYADPRGSDAWNDALSLRRAQSVAGVLVAAGVPRERIVVEAHGKSESTSASGDLDAYALRPPCERTLAAGRRSARLPAVTRGYAWQHRRAAGRQARGAPSR